MGSVYRRSSGISRNRSRHAVFEVGIFFHDFSVAEREHVAAIDLDLLAIGRGAGEHPLRDATIAGHEVPRPAEMRVGEYLEDLREGFTNPLAAFVACAA